MRSPVARIMRSRSSARGHFVNNGTGQLQAIDNGGGNWTVSADVNGNGTADLVRGHRDRCP